MVAIFICLSYAGRRKRLLATGFSVYYWGWPLYHIDFTTSLLHAESGEFDGSCEDVILLLVIRCGKGQFSYLGLGIDLPLQGKFGCFLGDDGLDDPYLVILDLGIFEDVPVNLAIDTGTLGYFFGVVSVLEILQYRFVSTTPTQHQQER